MVLSQHLLRCPITLYNGTSFTHQWVAAAMQDAVNPIGSNFRVKCLGVGFESQTFWPLDNLLYPNEPLTPCEKLLDIITTGVRGGADIFPKPA